MSQTNQPTSEVYTFQQSVTINAPQEVVFAYLSDYTNDPKWRKEVNKLTGNRSAEGNVIIENSFLSKKVPNWVSEFVCTVYKTPDNVVYETTKNSHAWQKNKRTCIALPGGETQFVYELEFEQKLIFIGLGFNLPSFITKLYTQQTMKKYLKQLKWNLEKQ